LLVILVVGIASIGIGSLAPIFNIDLQDLGIFNSKDELDFSCICVNPQTQEEIPCPELTICPQP